MKKLILVVMLVFLMAIPAFGASYDLTIAWDANTESDLATGTKARYKVYIRNGQSLANVKTNASQVLEVQVAKDEDPSPTVVQFTVRGLSDQIKYYVAVDAWDESGNASDLSNEINTIPIDATAPDEPTGLKILRWIRSVLSKLFGGLREA